MTVKKKKNYSEFPISNSKLVHYLIMASANHLPSVLFTKTVSVALNLLNDASSGGNAYNVHRNAFTFVKFNN